MLFFVKYFMNCFFFACSRFWNLATHFIGLLNWKGTLSNIPQSLNLSMKIFLVKLTFRWNSIHKTKGCLACTNITVFSWYLSSHLHLFISSTILRLIHFIYHSPSHSYLLYLVTLILHRHSTTLVSLLLLIQFCLWK